MIKHTFDRGYDTHGYTGSYGSARGGSWVSGVRGANMRTGHTVSPMHTYHPYLLHNGGPGMVRPGEEWKGLGSALARGAMGTAQRLRQKWAATDQQQEPETTPAMPSSIGVVQRQPGPSPLQAGFRPTLPKADTMDANRPPSPSERQQQQEAPPLLNRVFDSRVGRFLEGRYGQQPQR